VRKIFANNLLAIVGLALFSIGSAEAQHNVFVDLALYRPSTGQFFIRSSLNGSVTAIQFGAPGDHGLLCKWQSNTSNGGDNLLVFRNGTWFVNYAGDGATVNIAFPYGAPTDQPLCANFGANIFAGVGLFRNGLWFVGQSSGPTFSFGQGGDVPVYINAKGFGNATDRQNVVYGVYRAGTWFLDTTGLGTPNITVNFGGLIQDVPLMIPGWNGTQPLSLAIYRDGTWFIKPDPNLSTIVTVQFGAIGDIPLVRGAH
jgi:hypothetical protein